MIKMMEDFEMNDEELEMELDRMLELFKQLELEKEMMDAIDELEELAEEQEKLSEETENEEGEDEELQQKQEEINKEFELLLYITVIRRGDSNGNFLYELVGNSNNNSNWKH